MSIVAAITAVSFVAIPLATLCLSVISGPMRSAILLLAVTVLAICSPYVYFGLRALSEGYELAAVFSQVSVTTGPILTIAWPIIQWSLAALVIGTALRAFWGLFRKEMG